MAIDGPIARETLDWAARPSPTQPQLWARTPGRSGRGPPLSRPKPRAPVMIHRFVSHSPSRNAARGPASARFSVTLPRPYGHGGFVGIAPSPLHIWRYHPLRCVRVFCRTGFPGAQFPDIAAHVAPVCTMSMD
jgi:hypothetical protein